MEWARTRLCSCHSSVTTAIESPWQCLEHKVRPAEFKVLHNMLKRFRNSPEVADVAEEVELFSNHCEARDLAQI
jgi:hypothetical protein